MHLQLTRLGIATVLAFSPFSNVSISDINITEVAPVCVTCSVPPEEAQILTDIVDVTLSGGSPFVWPMVDDDNKKLEAIGQVTETSIDHATVRIAFNMSYVSKDDQRALHAVYNTAASMTSLNNADLGHISFSILDLQDVNGILELGVLISNITSQSHTDVLENRNDDATKTDDDLSKAVLCRDTSSGEAVVNTSRCQTLDDTKVYVAVPLICHWWNSVSEAWNTEGCITSLSDDGQQVVCTCSHTTSYSVLVKSDGVSSMSTDNLIALEVITNVGSVISAVALFATFIILTFYWRRPFMSEHHKLIAILAGVLLILQLLLVVMLHISRSAKTSSPSCVAMSFILHFSMMFSFTWMSVIGFNVYRSFVAVMRRKPISITRAIISCLIASFGIAIVTYSSSPDTYTSADFCWLDMQTLSLLGFAIPLALMLTINTGLMSVSMRAISKEASLKVQARAAMTFMWILGLTWIFAALSLVDRQNIAWDYLFALSAICQGLFLLLHYILGSQQVRHLLFVGKDEELSRRQQTFAMVRKQEYETGRTISTIPLSSKENTSSTQTHSSSSGPKGVRDFRPYVSLKHSNSSTSNSIGSGDNPVVASICPSKSQLSMDIPKDIRLPVINEQQRRYSIIREV